MTQKLKTERMTGIMASFIDYTGKHLPDDAEAAVQPSRIEEDPGKVHLSKSDDPQQPPGKLPPGPVPQIFRDLENSMQHPPEEEIQRTSMPKTRHRKYDQNVQIFPQ